MLLLASLLSFGWPAPKVETVHALAPHPGLTLVRLNKCCGSMRPLIQGGELAYVETYKDQELEPGMVVAANGKLHMIVSMIGERIYTAGINNTRTDWRGRKKDVQFILRILVKP